LQKKQYQIIINSVLELAEASKETYPDEEGSLSGSMLSLAHSNSSTSFLAGSL
jgi:thousand and one amino acid protein kinase